MSDYDPHAAPVPARSWLSWGFSFAFHITAIVALASAMRPWPHGAGDHEGNSISIVLGDSKSGGEMRPGDEGQGDTVNERDQVFEPPALLATPTPAESMAEVVQQTRMWPVRLAAAPAAEAANPSNRSSQQPSGRPATGGIGRSGTPGGTGYATTSVFGVEGKGNKFVYLFDRSASMEGAPLSAAKKQLLQSLKALESVHQFQIIFFNSRTQVFDATIGGRRVAFASDRNKQLAANFVGGITADGGTDRMVALREAIGFAPNVIFFLSDADDPMSAGELAEIAKLNERVQAAICVIEFGRGPAPGKDNFLMQLARQSGGKYGYVDTTKLVRQRAAER
jgi:hypothetical protein